MDLSACRAICFRPGPMPPPRSFSENYAEVNYANAGLSYPFFEGLAPAALAADRRARDYTTPKNDACVNFFVAVRQGRGVAPLWRMVGG